MLVTGHIVLLCLAGLGFVELGRITRPDLTDDMGRQLVSFGVVGALSTTVSLLLFLCFRSALGVMSATVVALGATAFANLWANRRFTFLHITGIASNRHNNARAVHGFG